MLIDILRMPATFGAPINRRQTIVSSSNIPKNVRDPIVYWPSVPFFENQVTVGAVIDTNPSRLFKAIYVSMDGEWLFETTFSQEVLGTFCLYTKIFSRDGVNVVMGMNTIHAYQSVWTPLMPINHLPIIGNDPATGDQELISLVPSSVVDHLVPIIFGEKNLFRHVHRLLDIRSAGLGDNQIGWSYRPIYDHIPSVWEALIEGKFYRSPFSEIRMSHPSINLTHDPVFLYENVRRAVDMRGAEVYTNHESFDNVVLSLISLIPTKINISVLMSSAAADTTGLWHVEEYDHPYRGFLRKMNFEDDNLNRKITDIFYQCIHIYCRLYFIETETFLRTASDQSSITINKNIYDEVSITFHDIANGRYVCFYSSFPILSLTTLAVLER